jgi:hypothetical protein
MATRASVKKAGRTGGRTTADNSWTTRRTGPTCLRTC